MNKNLLEKVYQECKKQGLRNVTKKAITIYVNCQKNGDYAEIHQTPLYIKHGGQYCRMLEVLNWNNM